MNDCSCYLEAIASLLMGTVLGALLAIVLYFAILAPALRWIHHRRITRP